MSRFILAICTLQLSLTLNSPVFAQEIIQKEVVNVPKDQVINQDFFATGEKIVVSGIINGDVYLFAGNIIVDGEINGDLIAGAGTVNISGKVSDDVRVGAGQIEISGRVGKNITAGGGNVSLGENAQIGGSLVTGAGNVSIFAPISKGATVGAGNLTIGDSVGGNVIAGVGSFSLLRGAKIGGDLAYWSSEKADFQPGSQVVGKTVFHQTEKKEKEAAGTNWGIKVYSFLVTLVIGLILIRLMPVFVENTANKISSKPAASLVLGLLVLVGTPIAVVIIAITVIGIPISLLLILGYLIGLCIAKIFTAVSVGKILSQYFRRKINLYLALLTGLIVYYVLSVIPIIGFLTIFAYLLTGFGSLVWTKKEIYTNLRAKKLI